MHKEISLITITLMILIFPPFPSTTATDTTTIYVDPPTTTMYYAYIGENFTVNIAIAEVIDLCGWEFKLYYNKTVLNCINATEGPFLKAGGNTYFISNINNIYNATHGQAHVSCTLTGMVPGVNGNGVLATIEFQIKASGDTPLHLDGTKLLDSSLPDPNPIDHNTIDGTVIATPLVCDVAVTNVRVYKTVPTTHDVSEGYPTWTIYVNVTVHNNGTVPTNCTVTVYYYNVTTHQIDAKNLTNYDPCNTTTLTFEWNLSSVSRGIYTVKANVTCTCGASDEFVDGTMKIKKVGDVTGEGTIDVIDLSAVALATVAYYQECDFDLGGSVDVIDLSAVALATAGG